MCPKRLVSLTVNCLSFPCVCRDLWKYWDTVCAWRLELENEEWWQTEKCSRDYLDKIPSGFMETEHYPFNSKSESLLQILHFRFTKWYWIQSTVVVVASVLSLMSFAWSLVLSHLWRPSPGWSLLQSIQSRQVIQFPVLPNYLVPYFFSSPYLILSCIIWDSCICLWPC